MPDATKRTVDAAETERIRDYYRRRRFRTWRAVEFVIQERRELLRRAAFEFGCLQLEQTRILDVGCGAGGDLAFWRQAGIAEARLFGTDLVADHVATARATMPAATVVAVDGFDIPFGDRSFELTTASLVFSSILDNAARTRLFEEMIRVTTHDGVVAIYDFRIRKPWNTAVIALTDRRVAALKRPPDAEWAATPFLPLLPLALALPRVARRPLLAILPRTHVLRAWKMAHREA